MALLLLAIVSAGCSTTDFQEKPGAEEDPPAGAARRSSRLGLSSVSQPKLFGRTCGLYALLTVATSPLTEPSGIASALRVLRLPLGASVRSALLSVAAGLYSVRQRFEWAILLWHEAFTSLSADLLAQAIEAPHAEEHDAEEEATATVGGGDGGSSGGAGAASGSGTGGGGGGRAERAVDWRRAARTATVSLLSDDLPFLVWSRLIWIWAEKAKAALRTSALAPRLIRALTHPATVTVAKTALTQLVYETSSDSAYLAMQAALRGGGLRAVGAELRAKLWTLRRDGLAYWSVMHLALFSIPVWWVQPIADNITTMIFNIYQSFLSHQTLDSLEADDNQASTGV